MSKTNQNDPDKSGKSMENNPEPDYIAFKKPGDDFLTWYDRSTFATSRPKIPAWCDGTKCQETTFHATGKFVTRVDGEVAEVWEPLVP